MFLEELKVVKTTPCLIEENRFRAFALSSANLDIIFPYLNAVLEKPNYKPLLNMIVFKKGIVTFELHKSDIEVRNYANTTELYELLDWVQDLINGTYKNRSNITPDYNPRRIIPPIKLYNLLPKKNCKECGEPACLAFAVKLSNSEVDVDGCRQLQKSEFAELRPKLESAME